MDYQPCNILAEQSLIGAILLDGGSDYAMENVKADDFYDKKSREYFEAILLAHSRNDVIEYATIADLVPSRNFVDLGELIKNTHSSANLKGYAKAVYEFILSNNEDVMITVSMRRAKEKNEFFRSLGFTNFMGDIGVDAEGREHIQIGEKGLCHLTTMGIIDNTVENISKWQEIADDRTLSSEQRDNRLMAEMKINNTTNELEVA